MSTTIDSALANNHAKAEQKTTAKHQKQADEYLNEIKLFEQDRVELAKTSAKTAWKVATGSGVLALILGITIVVMMPLKTVDYRLLYIDPQTGMSQIIQPLADARQITYGEALDKHWLNRYVITRGAYQWQTVQDAFDYIKLTSRHDVFSAYSTQLRAKNSPVEVFKDYKKIRLEDVAISFLPTRQDQMLAQVFFTKVVLNSDDTPDTSFLPTKWSTTITFDYLKEITKESERQLNPLGFRVTSYQENRVIQ
ncbi:virB8 family protein [Vibrio sp. dhg]|uniref:virB8 family protein n=1 Tax=Vibrio sp. dhg TaxID=2163016 RepID=UPI000E4C89E9|nr:VirB8/TrbF family protein [Vibrio sp. dhg]AXT72973.1 conjugal transfer protein TraG [Vibrio sp. dhg]